MKNKFFVIVELILLVSAIVFAILWIMYPEKNYEPFTIIPGLFSGVLEIIRRILNKGKNLKSKVPIEEEEDKKAENYLKKKISNITVNEIVESINTSAPFLKEEMSKKYNGIRIKWTGYLRSADIDGKDKVRIRLNVKKDSIIGNSIWFTEKTEKIPEIKTLPKESKICVLGDIISASGPGISVTLKPIDIEIIRNV